MATAKTTKKSVKKTLWFVLAVLILLTSLYFLKSLFIVALVNNRPISRFGFDRILEKQGGQQVLNNIITEMLIKQEAKKQNVTASQADLDQKYTEIDNQLKAQGQTLDAALTANGQTRADFDSQMKTQVVLEKMLGKDISVTDEEINTYFTENKDTFDKGATLESEKENIKSILIQDKLSAKFQPWLQELQDKAKIFYFLKF